MYIILRWRVNRHIRYLQNLGHNVIHINVNRYFSFETGCFSKYGEKGYRINIGDYSQSLLNRLRLHILFFTPILSLIIMNVLKQNYEFSSTHTVIHVHDYELLITAIYLRVFLPGKNVIVYDRHEYLEIPKIKHSFFDHIPRIYEKITAKHIDGLVDISKEHLEKIKNHFPYSELIVVPNYPDDIVVNNGGINSKLQCIDNEKLLIIYFGSLDENLDRDISLTLKIMENILISYHSSKAFIGGLTSNKVILDKFNELEYKYPQRFCYLGFVPNKTVLEHTYNATFGTFLLKSDSYSSGSSNKVYEYLRFGVIPILKGNIENINELSVCSLFFSNEDNDEMIVSKISDLIHNKDKMKKMVNNSYELGKKFTFNSVKSRYNNLYLNLLHLKNN